MTRRPSLFSRFLQAPGQGGQATGASVGPGGTPSDTTPPRVSDLHGHGLRDGEAPTAVTVRRQPGSRMCWKCLLNGEGMGPSGLCPPCVDRLRKDVA